MGPRYLVEVLAKEVGGRGVTMNSILPTATAGAGVSTGGVRAELQAQLNRMRPIQRMGTLADTADAAEYLASELAGFVSGQHLLLSGGGRPDRRLDAAGPDLTQHPLEETAMAETRKTRLVAVEEHFVTDDYFANAADLAVPEGEEPERAFVTNFPKNAAMLRRFTDMGTRVGEMDAAGVDVSILTLNPPGVQIFSDAGKAATLAREANDRLAGIIAERPDRFFGLGSLAPQDPEAAAVEIKRVMGKLRLGGVMIASHTHGRYLDEPECEPILAALEEEDATLYLHPRSPSP